MVPRYARNNFWPVVSEMFCTYSARVSSDVSFSSFRAERNKRAEMFIKPDVLDQEYLFIPINRK